VGCLAVEACLEDLPPDAARRLIPDLGPPEELARLRRRDCERPDLLARQLEEEPLKRPPVVPERRAVPAEQIRRLARDLCLE
jgi:hypothetical protein